MKANIILSGMMLLVVVFNFFIKKSKAYWLISGYEMQKNKRKNIDWAGVSNFLFYSSLIAFFIVSILGFILQIHYDISDIIFVKIFGVIVIIYALFVIIYSRIKYDHNKR